ncbi:hypothetical protein ACQ4N8_24540, partial [Paenibacillus macerans]
MGTWRMRGLAAGVGLTGLLAGLMNGMFFTDTPGALLLISVWLLAAAGAAAIWGIGHLLGRRNSGGIGAGGVGSLRYVITVAGPFGIAALYGLCLLAGRALSVQATIEAMLSWTFIGVMGTALFLLAARHKDGRRFLVVGWLSIGSLLAITALAAMYGLLLLPGAVLRTADPAVSATGARLGGLLQYPNAFGAAMAAFLLERLGRMARMERGDFARAGGWRGQRAGALALLFALGLVLSESRGALAAALLGWTAGLALLRGAERRGYVLHSAAIAGAAAVLARQQASPRQYDPDHRPDHIVYRVSDPIGRIG